DDNTLAYYSSMLDAIPNDDTVPYDKWFRIGAAVYELGWGDTGRTMWHDWSAKAPKHTDEEFDKAWAGFPKYRETHLDNLVTPGTLVHYAAESGWTTPSEVTPPPPPPAVFIPPPELVEAGDRYALHVAEVLFKGPELTDKLCYPKNSFRNARWVLAQLGVRGRFDEFSGHKEIMFPDEDWTLRTDAVDGRARVAVMWACHGTDVGDGHVRAALDELCVVGRHNPVRDYLARLRWDGVSRLDTWLTDYCGASDTPLNRFYGSATLVAAVRRVFKDYPVPFDHMLVLEGPQGVGKSTVVQVLGRGLSPEGWYKNQEINWADPRTALEVFRGCWFYEWAELSGHNRADSRRIKSCLSSQSDEGRVAYAHNPDATIRRTILVGTVNPLEAYLDDQTGNRRYWCVRTGDDKFRLDEFRRDIDQIYAEAVVREKTWPAFFEVPRELWTEQQEALERRTEEPELCYMLRAVGSGKGDCETDGISEWIVVDDIKKKYCQVLPLNKWLDVNIAKAMHRLGWIATRKYVGGKQMRCYVRPICAP